MRRLSPTLNSPATTRLERPEVCGLTIHARNAELRRKILAVILLRKRGGLAVQADPDFVDQRGAELIGVPDAGVLIARSWWLPRPEMEPPRGRPNDGGRNGARILERMRDKDGVVRRELVIQANIEGLNIRRVRARHRVVVERQRLAGSIELVRLRQQRADLDGCGIEQAGSGIMLLGNGVRA